MKIFVIGPVAPYKGGISHSGTQMCQNLAKKHDVTAISFTRMYPKLLFKDSPYEKDAKENHHFKTVTMIDALNPFTWHDTVQFIKKEKPDRVIFQWWTTYLTACFWYIEKRIKKHTRTGVILQNVFPHMGDDE
jgi:hypothetical protein